MPGIAERVLNSGLVIVRLSVCPSRCKETFAEMHFEWGRLKMRYWNYRHQNCRGGKCGTKHLWKAKTPAGLEVSLLLLTCYGSHNMIYLIICPNLQCSVCFYISCMYVCITFLSVF